MVLSNLLKSNATGFTNNSKLLALETSLNQSITNFQDLIADLQQVHNDSENYRLQFLTAQEKCENKSCTAAVELQKVISIKDHIIESVASTLTKLSETKDFNILSEAFKILFQEIEPLTPPTSDEMPSKTHPSEIGNKTLSSVDKNIASTDPNASITEDVSYEEESLCEIEGTPTGRTSPIIYTKKSRSMLTKTEGRDKKKCPEEWPTSESKAIKLMIFSNANRTPKGSGKLRQSRLQVSAVRSATVVDLTCSPDAARRDDPPVQPLIKKESMEDDTILPSPTSGPTNFTLLKTSTSKGSPSKFKRPKQLSLKTRCGNAKQDENKDTTNTHDDMDESINILNQFANRIRDIKKENSTQKASPVKRERQSPIKTENISTVKRETDLPVPDEDATNASIHLEEINRLEEEHTNVKSSPTKRPLCENINITNTPPRPGAEASLSILRPEPETAALEAAKRRLPELVEPVYKEPTVRNKAEKRNQQGWSCDECEKFYGVLYKDEPVVLAQKVHECSKHRGRRNPARPRTPPNFWNPRWTVPDDTEELNRMNNAG